MTKDFILNKIKLHNFYLYKGDVEIIFDTSDSKKNLYLFNFNNGGGKTSLYHGIKWGFFGSQLKYYKGGIQMSLEDMMSKNTDEDFYYIQLDFTHNDDKCKIYRICKYPFKRDSLTLYINGHEYFDEEATDILSSIVPLNYGQLFMFDGTDISSLVGTQDDKYKVNNVLKLLGLEDVNRIVKRLPRIADAYNEEIIDQRKINEQYSEYVKICHNAKEQIRKCEISIKNYKNQIEEKELEISNIDKQLSQINKIQTLINDKTELERQQAEQKGYQKALMDKYANLKNQLLIYPMLDEIKEYLEDIDNQISIIQNELQNDPIDLKSIDLMVQILKEHITTCPVCKQSIDAEARETIQKIIDNANIKNEDYKNKEEKIRQLYDDKLYFSSILDKSAADLAYKTTIQYNAAQERIDEYSTEIDRIFKIIADNNGDRVSIYNENREKFKNDVRNLNRDITDVENEKAKYKLMYDKNIKKLKNNSEPNDKITTLSKRHDLCEKLEKKLSYVIQIALKSKRDEILKYSTDFYLSISNKKDVVKELRYIDDDSYSMEIIKFDGNAMVNPSMGETQILALCFLFALCKCSGRLTPIVMDTPSTNLDEIHAKGLENCLKMLPNQIIFLAQPNEANRTFFSNMRDIVAQYFVVKHDEHNNGTILEETL